MKKKLGILSLLVLAGVAFMATLVQATSFTTVDGSVILKPRQAVVVSATNASQGAITQNYISVVDLTVGQPVKLVGSAYLTGTALTYATAVTLSATLGDPAIIGVVAYPTGTTRSSAGAAVDVAGIGSLCLVRVGGNVSVTAGTTVLVQSGTAGLLTPSAGLTESGFQTNLTPSALVGGSAIARVVETKGLASGATQLVKARIIHP